MKLVVACRGGAGGGREEFDHHHQQATHAHRLAGGAHGTPSHASRRGASVVIVPLACGCVLDGDAVYMCF